MRIQSLLLLFVLLGGCATMPSNQELREASSEPAPDRQAGTAMIENAVRSGLKDPDSATFEWPNGFVFGSYKRLLGPLHTGWITCGTVNAKNGYGGYTGKTAVIGVIRNGSVIETNLDEPSARFNSRVAKACAQIGVPVI